MTQTAVRKTLTLGITARCNYRCSFCILGDIRASFADMDGVAIRKILDDRKGRYRCVSFSGGEPTLMLDLPRWVAYAKRLGYSVQVSSNGRMFSYMDYCRLFGPHGVDMFCISLSAHTSGTYEKMTRTKGGFRQTLKGIENLLSLKQRVMTNTVVHRQNYRFLPALAKFLVARGLEHCRFTFPMTARMNPGIRCPHPSFSVPRSDVPKAIRFLKEAMDVLIAHGVTPAIAVLPFCYLRGYEKYGETFNDDAALYLAMRGNRPVYVNMCDRVSFWKNDTCRSCPYGAVCRGIERNFFLSPRKIRE